MNKNIDLTETLKGCEGIKVYYAPLGIYVELVSAKTRYTDFPIQIDSHYLNNPVLLTNTGAMAPKSEFPNAECVIFPSKDQRDWSKFVKHEHFDINTPFVCSDYAETENNEFPCVIRYYAGYSNNKHHCFSNGFKSKNNTTAYPYKYMIPYNKFDINNIKESLKYNIQK